MTRPIPGAPEPRAILSVAVENPGDVAVARQRARRIAELLGFDFHDQARIAAAVSEIARNAVTHGGGARGRCAFLLENGSAARPPVFLVRVSDAGPGFADAAAVLEGRSPGLGIPGARRLMDAFRILPGPPGTGAVVELGKQLPPSVTPPNPARLRAIVERLAADAPPDPAAVLAEQNRELVQSLDDLRRRGEELERLNAELEDTNRGVVALHAELEERAEAQRLAAEAKSRFLSNVGHEFRTPLNSILALARLLLDRADGPLAPEQERQVSLIRRSAADLALMVDDLLDLSKAEAGRLDVHATAFTVAELFGGLRGLLRPLLPGADPVALVFEDARGLPPLMTDEGKLTQILRNLLSNALKFTEAGEVRVAASYDATTDRLRFTVRDSGIGIAPDDQSRVFEEFEQVRSPLQQRSKGTGLGLPLARRLAELLGGRMSLDSVPGQGSTFSFDIPRRHKEATGAAEPAARRRRVLVVDDDEGFRYVLRQMIDPRLFDAEETADGASALTLARSAAHAPDAILLDLRMPGLDGLAVAAALAADPATRRIPVVIATSTPVDDALRARLGRAGAVAVMAKGELSRGVLTRLLEDALARHGGEGPTP
jgi:signal transduction histidine kinase/CheY-like chemotaxis protein